MKKKCIRISKSRGNQCFKYDNKKLFKSNLCKFNFNNDSFVISHLRLTNYENCFDQNKLMHRLFGCGRKCSLNATMCGKSEAVIEKRERKRKSRINFTFVSSLVPSVKMLAFSFTIISDGLHPPMR